MKGMRPTIAVLFATLVALLVPRAATAACAVERGRVKTAADAQASEIRLAPIPATIEGLHVLPAPRPLPQDGRIGPAEMSLYSVTATLIAYALTPEGEIHLVLSDEQRRTMVAKIPSPACMGGSRFASDVASARAEFERRYVATETFKEARQPIEVRGVGFFDFQQGQRGLAPNGLSLHPVTAIDFTPLFSPKPPPVPGRRRAAGVGGARTCPRASLSLTTSRASACAGETVTVAWQASDPSARVAIDGIGTSLPASGSRNVSASASVAYSGRATNACGAGNEAVAVLTLTPAPTASISGPSNVSSGGTATLSILMNGLTSWTLTSALGNSISPNSGTANRTVSYAANRAGSDTITLLATGSACGNVTATHTILVNSQPPPPTGGGGLLCCDGTRSPSCFNCSDKRGCCSGHGGVCGCP
ncbi:MAG TPA: hypothetical protein VEK11_19250 [Thermoanaerobaculia bacterium]|nr:hypothetical protein [Thermoanaerobaculia bacterium]